MEGITNRFEDIADVMGYATPVYCCPDCERTEGQPHHPECATGLDMGQSVVTGGPLLRGLLVEAGALKCSAAVILAFLAGVERQPDQTYSSLAIMAVTELGKVNCSDVLANLLGVVNADETSAVYIRHGVHRAAGFVESWMLVRGRGLVVPVTFPNPGPSFHHRLDEQWRDPEEDAKAGCL